MPNILMSVQEINMQRTATSTIVTLAEMCELQIPTLSYKSKWSDAVR